MVAATLRKVIIVNAAHRVWSFLPCGIREPLALLLTGGLVALAGSFSGAWNLYGPLALWPAEFWRGRVWQAVTYPLLPFGPADLIFNGFLFAVLGTRLMQELGWRQFGLFCLVAIVGTAAVKLALTPFNHAALVGIGGVIYAMFAAWCRLFSNEDVMLMGVWRMSMRTAMMIIAGMSMIFGLLSPCGFWNQLAMLGGGATGWLYLAGQSRWLLRRGPQPLASERIRRLEL
jgi:membrane associated rhomboid family serine protease